MFGAGSRLSILASVAVAALGLSALSAPALAKEKTPQEFEASAAAKTKGASLGPQEFRFAPLPFTIKCAEAISTGSIEATKSDTLKDKVTFKECKYGHKGEARVTPFEFEFSSEGTFTIANAPKITLVQSDCTVEIEEGQTVGEEAKRPPVTYTNKGEAPDRRLEIKTKVHPTEHGAAGGIAYEFGKLCAEFENKSGEGGIYSGDLLDEIVNGELAVS